MIALEMETVRLPRVEMWFTVLPKRPTFQLQWAEVVVIVCQLLRYISKPGLATY